MIRAALTVGLTFLYILTAGPIVILLATIFRQPEWVYWTGIGGVHMLLRLAGTTLEVDGRENLHPGVPCIYVANHVSNIDPPAIAAILPRVVILAKKEVWKIPVFGYAMNMASFIPVDRGTERAAAVVHLGVDRLQRGFSILAFPEGTRSRTHDMLPFRHGTFLMAIRAGAPIVPVTILGSRSIMPKGASGIRPGTIRFIAHPPVPTTGMAEGDRKELAERVQATIASAL